MLSNFRQIIKIVFRALLTNKTRSFLTMLGIVIGVGAVVLIMSLGAGAKFLILSQVDSFGGDLIGILPGQSNKQGPPASVFGIQITSLKESDAKAISNPSDLPYVKAVASYFDTSVSATYKDISYSTTLEGISGDYLEVEGASIETGRFFTNQELSSLSSLVVLGSSVADELFSFNDPVGKKIKLKNRQVTVIGVFQERGVAGFSNPDDIIYAPLRFTQKEIAGVDYLTSIRVKINDEKYIDESINIISSILRDRHNISDPANDDFSVRSFRDALDLITTITDALRYFLAAMAALSLLVGGVGIMNIMLVGVTERTREIGLRKALGATKRQIRFQFLIEAVILTLIGGIVGLIGGALISYLVSLVVHSMGYEWSYIISLPSALLALSISAIIGIIFGYYPAKKASNLNPIEALRYE